VFPHGICKFCRFSHLERILINFRVGMYATDRFYKILLLGDPGVGKKSIAVRFVEGEFHSDTKSYTGCDVMMRTLYEEDGTSLKIHLWPISSQQPLPSYYRGAVGAFVVFDISDVHSFDSVIKWKEGLCGVLSGIPIVLLANKSDLVGEEWCRKRTQMGSFCKRHGFTSWCEVSAKDGDLVEESFQSLIRGVYNADKRDAFGGSGDDGDGDSSENSVEKMCCL
jgi:small GTP-binding protein